MSSKAWYRDDAQSWQLSESVFKDGKALCQTDLEQLSKAGVPGSTKLSLRSETYGLNGLERRARMITL